MLSFVTVYERSPVCAWSIGASPETSTVLDSVPTSIGSAPRATRSPGLTSTPLRSSVLKPVSVTRAVYVSPGMFEMTKSPVLEDCVSNIVPRLSLITVTAAPGITPPCVSCTVPAIVAVVAWAAADDENPSTAIVVTTSASARYVRVILIVPPEDKILEAELCNAIESGSDEVWRGGHSSGIHGGD